MEHFILIWNLQTEMGQIKTSGDVENLIADWVTVLELPALQGGNWINNNVNKNEINLTKGGQERVGRHLEVSLSGNWL